MSEESETNAEDETPAFFEDADAPDQEKEEFRRLDARERPTASQEGSPDTTAAANASIHRGSRYEGGTDELTSDIGAGPTDPLASDIDVPVNSSDRPDVDITPTDRNRQSRPVDGDPVASSEDGIGAATETTLDRSDLPAPADTSVGATAPASRESAATASAADENQTEQQAPGEPVAAPQSAPNAAADDDAESTPTAQAPAVVFSGTTGKEDEAIAIDLDVALTDTDGNETLSITISGVPEGAQLSGGTDNGDGTWLLEPSDLAGLTITPPENFSGSISLAVTATATETTGQTAVTTATADITVQAVADAPVLTISDATGLEDQAIALNIDAALTDAGETLSVSISNIPEGSVLTLADGTEVSITGGTAALTPDQLEGLNLTPPADFSGEIALEVVATSTDGTDTATTSGTLNVGVTAVADAPVLTISDATGSEDQAIALNIDAALTDAGETLSVTIGNIPEGAVLTLADGTTVAIVDGTAELTPDQLAGLSLTPPADFSGEIALNVTATSTDGTDTATTSGTLNVSVTAVADAPVLNVSDATGSEDQAIALDIQSALTDTDGSETLSVTIGNIPEGSVLTLADGTEVSITGGTAALTPDQLEGLSLTPPADFSGEIALDIVATSTDGTDTATTSGTLNVGVTAVADAPGLEVTDAAGNEDTAIALDIQSALTDTDGSETLSVSIGNIPEGAVLTLADGTVIPVTGGTATLTPDQLDDLSLTPPADFSGEIALEVVATSTDGTDTATTSGTLNVGVTAVADAPTLELTDANGLEDQAIALNIDAALTDAGETLGVTIGNIPEGAVLTLADGTVMPVTGGTATLTPDQLAGLSLTPPADFSGDIALEITATSTDGTDTATTSGTLNISVTAVADAPVLNVSDAAGSEDQAIALDIDSSLVDGGEVLSISIGDIPEGSILAAGDGTVIPIEAGVAVLSPDQLTGLILTPPADFSGEIALDIVATSTDGTDTATTSGTLNISVTAVADAPGLEVTDVAGNEDTAIALDIQSALTDTDGSETLSVTIGNIPEGAVLTLADGTVIPVTGGTAALTPDQLAGLSLTPPADFSGDIALEVVATSTDGTDTATTSGTLNISVTAVADAPVLNVSDAAGSEDQAIALDIDAALTDAGETLSVTIGNIPEGAVLTLADGTVMPVTGSTATLTPDQLAGLSLTPPADFSGEIALDIVATSTDGTDTATTSSTLNISVTAVADAPTLDLTDATGSEDQAIALNIDAALTDAGETLGVSIGNIPEGAVLTLADGTVIPVTGGTAALTPDQLAGLSLTPPADFSGEIALDIVATSTDGTDTATTSGTLNISVTAVADAPVLNVSDAAGSEDQAIALDIDSSLVDGGEVLSISIGDIPEGSILAAGDGTVIPIEAGVAVLSPDQLTGLILTPPADFSGEIALDIVATSTDGTDTATTSGTLNISVTAVADAPGLEVTDAAGNEDTAIALDIQSALTDTDGSETLSVSIGNIPEGAVLTLADGTVMPVTGGTATLTPDQLAGLSLTPPADFSGDIALEITATSTDGTDTATTSGTLNISVTAVADAPVLNVSDAAGSEDQAIALDIDSSLVDGGEVLSISIGDIPEGSILAAGDGTVIPIEAGVAVLSPDQLTGLILTPPADFSGEIALDIVATSTDGTDTATTSGTLNISVTAVADAPGLEVTDVAGNEDTAIALDIQSALTDTDGSETLSVTIGNIPEGSVLALADGTVIPVTGSTATLTPDQLAGLSLTPPADFSGEIALDIVATSTDGTDTATTSGTLNVGVTAVADAPVLTISDATGLEDQAIALNIDAALTDSGETLSVTIGNIPKGAVLTLADGTVIPVTGGTATLTPDQLAGLSLTPPADFSGEIALDIVATSTDGSDTATTSGTLNVGVTAVADAPGLEVTDAAGNEDTAIALDIQSALTDTDGSETLSVSIGNIPEGAVLTLADGTVIPVTGGTATLTPDQLDDLSLTPPADFSGEIALEVVATSTDGTDTATTSGTLNVGVTAVADAPTLELTDANGLEDQAIALNIDAALTDAGETLGVTIGNIPEGAVLTLADGTVMPVTGGTATLTPDQLAGLSLTPPADFSGDIALEITATSTDGTDTATTSGTLNISVTAVADAPGLEVTDAAGNEDTAIALDIQSALTDTDGSETLSVSIGNIPEGAVLTLADGTVIPVTGGTATLTPDQLDDLSLTPPADFSGEIALEVVATSTDGTDTATTSGTLNVGVTAVADAPTLELTDANGLEDQAIALNIDAALTDAGETLGVTIGNIPEGAVLTLADGTVMPVTGGTATLTPDQLAGLSLTPPADFSGEIALDIVATSTDGTDTATTSGTLNISVTAVADAPTLDLTDATGSEDQAIALNIDAALTDAGETLGVTIGNIPEGAVLTLADGTVMPVTGGTAALTPDQLAGLSLTPPADFSGEIALDIVAASTDGTDTATTSGTLNVSVTAVADTPVLNVSDATGLEDQAIALDIDAALTDAGETLGVTIGNIPEGAVLTLADGTVMPVTGGTAELTPDQLAGLTITPPHDSDADFNLSVTTVSHDGTSTAMTSTSIHVAVQGVADAPPLAITVGAGTVSAVEIPPQSITIGQDNVTTSDSGFTVTARTLNSDGSLSEPSSDNISLNSRPVGFGVKGSASGADTELGFNSSTGTSEELTIAFDDAVTGADVSLAWAHGAEQAYYEVYRDGEKVGEGTIQGVTDGIDPPVAISATDGGTFDAIVFSSPGHDHDYLINEVNFETAPGSYEIIDYPLTIATGLTDTDGSEQLSVTVSGLPDGAVLSTGTANTDGSVTLTADELNGLVLTAPAGTGNILLSVTSTATESNGTSASISTQVSIDVAEPTMDGVADAPTLGVSDALGSEDSAITLDIQAALTDTDGSETLAVTIANVPDGAVLHLADGTVVPVAGGSAELTPEQLEGLSLTPPANFSGAIALDVSAISAEGDDTSTVTGTLNIEVSPVADRPILSVSLGDPVPVGGGASVLPDIDAFSHDVSNIVLYVETGGLITKVKIQSFRGAQIRDVNDLGIDAFMAEAYAESQLVGMTVKAGNNKTKGYGPGEGELVFVAEGMTEADLPVSAKANLELKFGDTLGRFSPVGGSGEPEGFSYSLTIDPTLVDTDGSEFIAISISGVPGGAVLSAGTDNGDGSWSLQPDDLPGLHFTVPGDMAEPFQLDISATATEQDGSKATASASVGTLITADGPQNAPEVSLGTTEFTQDFPIQPVSFAADAVLSDMDGSEISQAVIAISDGYNLGDILSVEGNTIIDDLTGKTMISGTNIEVVGGGFDLTSNALTLQGTDSVETYQSVINSLTFNSLSPELIEGTRTVSITVMDDTGLVSQTADLGITLNDPLATDLFADGGTATTDPALAALSDPALAETTDPNTDWLTATESEPVSAFDDPAAETALPDMGGADSGLSSDPAISDAQDLTTI